MDAPPAVDSAEDRVQVPSGGLRRECEGLETVQQMVREGAATEDIEGFPGQGLALDQGRSDSGG